jgi:hypothetical protein
LRKRFAPGLFPSLREYESDGRSVWGIARKRFLYGYAEFVRAVLFEES